LAEQSRTLSAESQRLLKQIDLLRKDLDAYILRLNKSRLTVRDLELQLASLHPKRSTGPCVFEDFKVNSFQEAINFTRDQMEASEYLAGRYRALVHVYDPAQPSRVSLHAEEEEEELHGSHVRQGLRKSAKPKRFYIDAPDDPALPPVAVERLQKEEPDIRYPKHVRLMMASCRIVCKHFQAKTDNDVIVAMRKLRTINQSLNETANHLRSVCPRLFRVRETVGRAIDDIKTTARGITRMLEDGEAFFNRTVVRRSGRRRCARSSTS
jgi:hypothetical protein